MKTTSRIVLEGGKSKENQITATKQQFELINTAINEVGCLLDIPDEKMTEMVFKTVEYVCSSMQWKRMSNKGKINEKNRLIMYDIYKDAFLLILTAEGLLQQNTEEIVSKWLLTFIPLAENHYKQNGKFPSIDQIY